MKIMVSGNRRKVIWFICTCFVSLVLVGMTAVIAKTAITASTSSRLVPIYKVAREDKAVSLTIDATWGDEQTPAILDLLDYYHVKVTFFLAGNWLESFPEMVKEISARGHEVGNHSLTHPHMSELSSDKVRKELYDTGKMIEDLTGITPVNFRPPFGDYNNNLITVAKECGYDTIQWSIDSLDWKDLTAQEIYKRVMKNIESGDIVLFHNAGLHTLEALDMIIKDLKASGYEILPIRDFIIQGEYTVDSSGKQNPKA